MVPVFTDPLSPGSGHSPRVKSLSLTQCGFPSVPSAGPCSLLFIHASMTAPFTRQSCSFTHRYLLGTEMITWSLPTRSSQASRKESQSLPTSQSPAPFARLAPVTGSSWSSKVAASLTDWLYLKENAFSSYVGKTEKIQVNAGGFT